MNEHEQYTFAVSVNVMQASVLINKIYYVRHIMNRNIGVVESM